MPYYLKLQQTIDNKKNPYDKNLKATFRTYQTNESVKHLFNK